MGGTINVESDGRKGDGRAGSDSAAGRVGKAGLIFHTNFPLCPLSLVFLSSAYVQISALSIGGHY